MMNEQLRIETKTFVDKIKASDDYVNYLILKAEIDRDPELSEAVDTFRRKSFEIQIGHQYGYFNAYENLIGLKNEHQDLLGEKAVKEYLQAELKVSKMLSDIMSAFTDEVDFDLNFLED